ncbi:hypothetical protein Pla111_24760 [Botrimarina hoheduenensis]|uniref:Uncharacterized protein n=1 Tax=Botrimarina hoheduenensis TaxID=2528000 RepID=A0A5C5VW44_9BACT|nr:hypothetical protein Pla111_24760 [Botrimarina hoheduenensis]
MFTAWPKEIPRRGVLVNSLDEQTPFKGFMTRGETVLLQRSNPDTLGARFLIIPFAEIAIVKFIDPLTEATFHKAGFVGEFAP